MKGRALPAAGLALLFAGAAAEAPGGLDLPPFRSHDHRWEWVDSWDLERPLVALLVSPHANDQRTNMGQHMAALVDYSAAGVETLVVTHQGNFGVNRNFAERHAMQMPLLFDLPDPLLESWVGSWSGELPMTIIFAAGDEALGWGDSVGVGVVLLDLADGVDVASPAYAALLETLHDDDAPVPPGISAALADWARWREYRRKNRRALGLESTSSTAGDGAFLPASLVEEGELMLAWAPRMGDRVLGMVLGAWQNRLLEAPVPEGLTPSAWLAPLLLRLEGLESRMGPSVVGWFDMLLDRPAEAAAHFGPLAEESGANWIHKVHLLAAITSDPAAVSPETRVPQILLDIFGTPATDRQRAFGHLARDLERVEGWWAETREMPPAFAFALGMTYTILGRTDLAESRLAPLRDDPVWGPVLAQAAAS